jgi:hypothetical protein
MYGEKNECGPPTPLHPESRTWVPTLPYSELEFKTMGQTKRLTNFWWPPKPPIQNEGYNPRTNTTNTLAHSAG